MPIYFQKVSRKNFNPDRDFHVKDSKGCNMTMGILFLGVFIATIATDRFDFDNPSIYQCLYLFVIPGIYLIRRSIINKTLITINKTGFYYLGELVTSWKNFIDAVIKQDDENRRIPYEITDRFVLVLRYYKDDEPGYFARKFLMTAVMDKSEEEIMAAIEFYYEQARIPVDVSIEPYHPPKYLNN